MILGVDVGGTHTDAVLLDHSGVVASAKVVTRHEDLLSSVRNALEAIFSETGAVGVEHFNLSTTLCTNAIIQNELEEVGVLVAAGPGMNPSLFKIGDNYQVVPGSLDHRGSEIKPLDLDFARQCLEDFYQQGVRVFALVGKFSPRNPVHEKQMAELLQDKCDFCTQGHALSSQLNFPRRIATAYYNSAVWPIFNNFANSVADSLKEKGINPKLNILKADGGTMSLSQARGMPVESIFSGPAASIMGIKALCDIQEDALLLDIGGTTTDVALFADGDPVIEAESVELKQYPTLVRAMKTRSVGVGGDTAVTLEDGELQIGPKRLGSCLAMGGGAPTLVDALNCVQKLNYGDVQASQRGMKDLGERIGIAPEEVAERIIADACREIREQAHQMLQEVNEKPVYTVHEFLEYRKVVPKRIYLMGGPAKVLAPYISREFGLQPVVPDNYSVANALGAAMARSTYEVELLADTEKHNMSIAVLGVQEKISGRYTLEQAKDDVRSHLLDYLKQTLQLDVSPDEIEIVEESAMNMIKGMYTVGQDIRVKSQIKPGIIPEYAEAARCVCKEQ
ncbi:MAG: hydantoinase/oxoprolinase family protein [Thermodesulfobacteriota bacterium]